MAERGVAGSQAERNALLEASNGQGAMTRPIWRLMNRLPKYVDRQLACLVETAYLLRSPWNTERLLTAMAPSTARPLGPILEPGAWLARAQPASLL